MLSLVVVGKNKEKQSIALEANFRACLSFYFTSIPQSQLPELSSESNFCIFATKILPSVQLQRQEALIFLHALILPFFFPKSFFPLSTFPVMIYFEYN